MFEFTLSDWDVTSVVLSTLCHSIVDSLLYIDAVSKLDAGIDLNVVKLS